MDIQRYDRDHRQILSQIDALRALSRAGIGENAEAISDLIISTASHIISDKASAKEKYMPPAPSRLESTA